MLVVEDEMLVLINIECALADLGCNDISAAATVEGALALLEEKQFDLAMLDRNLDGVMSDPVADALRAKSIPFVYATGYSDWGTDIRFGGQKVLIKPYSDHDLTAALKSILPMVPT